ncbi:MAG: hypothetical protein IPI07_02795 [Flavobacteriales bacterium]|nr:hypothetical protein [Flavobacteriales bacterium]
MRSSTAAMNPHPSGFRASTLARALSRRADQLNNVRDTIRYTAQVEPGSIFDLTTMVPLGLC